MRPFPVAFVLFAAAAAAATPTTLTVDVEGDEESVHLAFPLELAETALRMSSVGDAHEGAIRVGDREMKVSELRTLWKRIESGGDAELARVDDGDDHVRVRSKGGRVLVDVADADGSTVHVDLPHAVVDALLSGSGESLDVAGAVSALRALPAGEIVRVDDGEDHVRVRLE